LPQHTCTDLAAQPTNALAGPRSRRPRPGGCPGRP